MLVGIDISYWQGAIDFAAVKAAGAAFVIHKAGGSNASRYTDSKYASKAQQVRAAGLELGHYWMNGGGDAVDDANYFVDNLQQYRAGDPLILDVESIDGYTAWSPDKALAFLQQVRNRLPNSNIYVYMNSAQLGSSDWSAVARYGAKLWIANYGNESGNPAAQSPSSGPWPHWSIWQYAQNASIGPFRGDGNIARDDAFASDDYSQADRDELIGRIDQRVVVKLDQLLNKGPVFQRFRNSTNGEISLAGWGVWWPVPNIAYNNLLSARGLTTASVIDVPYNEYDFFKSLYLLSETNDKAILEAIKKLTAEEAQRAAKGTK